MYPDFEISKITFEKLILSAFVCVEANTTRLNELVKHLEDPL
jgi:hypothetical protein